MGLGRKGSQKCTSDDRGNQKEDLAIHGCSYFLYIQCHQATIAQSFGNGFGGI
jgi:hypothetical protein